MREFEKVMITTLKEMFKFKHFKVFSFPLRILVFIIMSPLIAASLVIALVYEVMYFFIALSQIPSEYIKRTIEENKVHPAPMVIVYIVAYPTKFIFDLAVSVQFISLSVIYFLFQITAYLACWGGFKYQPFLMKADLNIEKPEVTNILNKKAQIVLSLLIGSLTIIGVMLMIIIPIVSNNNMRLAYTSEGVNAYILDNGLSDEARVSTSYYLENEYGWDYAIVFLEDGENDYYFYVQSNGSYSNADKDTFDLIDRVYHSWTQVIENVTIKSVSASRLNKLIPNPVS